MDLVRFVSIEQGEDLILSFSFDEGTEFGIDGFIMQRNPKYEFLLQPHERGPSIDWTDDDEVITIKEVNLWRNEITLKTRYDLYRFDLSKISENEFKAVVRILKKMNFDKAFKFSQNT